MASPAFLPYGRQTIEDDDLQAVATALQGDFLTTGPLIAEFEKIFSQITGAKETVVCGNGTQALHLACMAAGIGPGDHVIVPTLTFLATANAVRYCGADVIFSDVDPETGLMTPDNFRAALDWTKKKNISVKAVMPVHLAGQMVAQAEIRNIAQEHGLKVITDACHALGSSYKGKQAGACAYEDLTAFSFHPVKTIAMGEGGAITTNNPDTAKRMRTLRSHGMVLRLAAPQNPGLGLDENGQPNPWYYEMPELGYNYRITDIQCALGISQLKKLERFINRRSELVAHYDELLPALAPVVKPPQRQPEGSPAWHLYAPRFDFAAAGISRAALMKSLMEEGIGTQVHYIPVHIQPYYKALYGDIDLPGAMRYYEQTLSLPLFPALDKAEVGRVVASLKKHLL